MKFSIITFGCKVNSYESVYIKEQLLNHNYILEEDYKKSNIVIVNTCSVTNTADNKCKKTIRAIRRENPKAILVVCGCSAEHSKESLNDLNIDILIGNKDKSKIITLIENYLKTNTKYTKFYNNRVSDFENMFVENFDNQTRAYVKIQDGCNNYCTYCVIPYVRGSIRSKNFADVLQEVQTLVNKGHKEIVLTGINTGAYGKETKKYDLVDLIQAISKIDKLERIRISSIEMTEINDKFIAELKNNSKLCGHLHVSLQSGSERILQIMNRKYTKEKYLNNINKIRLARPNINLTTDVIVGFPSETEDEFQECVNYCKQVGFSKIHVFPFSKRAGTKAATMPNQIPGNIIKERARKLIEIDKTLQLKYNQKFINQKVIVLIEEIVDGKSIGHTENFLKVEIPELLKQNENYEVVITNATAESVEANLVK